MEKLIMLDGSPMYIQAQIAQAIQGMPTSATVEQVRSYINSFIHFYCVDWGFCDFFL